jgi:hypothetical protein
LQQQLGEHQSCSFIFHIFLCVAPGIVLQKNTA